MTRQILQNKDVVPPGGFRYLQTDTAVWIKAASWGELIAAVKAHRRANNLPIGSEIEQEIETQLCATLPPGHCSYSDPQQKVRASMISRPGWRKFIELTRTMIEMHRTSAALVPLDTANEHAATCSRCLYNQRPDGCTSCAMQDLVGLLAPLHAPRTAHENALHGCMLCGCSLKAKVHFPAAVLAASAENLSAYPDWCWIKKQAELKK